MIQKLRVPLGFVIAAAVLYLAKPSSFSIGLGLPIVIAGAVFRGLAAGVIRKDARLATTGIYALTRNPLYFGSFLLALGFAFMSWNAIAAALLVIPSAIIYPTVIRNEEAHLARLFGGEFQKFRASVPVFFPRIGAFEIAFSFKQYWANREYNTAIGMAAAIAVLLLKSR